MPCDYKNYPLDWFTRIRPMILERAGNCCEECSVPNYAILAKPDREILRRNTSHAEARTAVKDCNPIDIQDGFVIIVLTIAHLDHFPLNNAPENLRALCQKCHNRHDAKHRATKRKLTRKKALESISPSLPLYNSKFQPV